VLSGLPVRIAHRPGERPVCGEVLGIAYGIKEEIIHKQVDLRAGRLSTRGTFFTPGSVSGNWSDA